MPPPASLFAGDGRVGLQRITADHYRLLVHLGAERYYAHDFERQLHVGTTGLATAAHHLTSAAISAPMKTLGTRAAGTAATEVGTWSWGSNSTSINGEYRQNSTAGNALTFTTPPGERVDKLGLWAYRSANIGGIHRVEIDGKRGVANLLPTAQQLVDLGKLASSALVANGGPLLPHDRCIDLATIGGGFAGKQWIPIADGLWPGQHTVTIVVSALTHVGGTPPGRAFIEGYGYGSPDYTWQTAGIDFLPLWGILLTDASAHEYAHQLKPTAGTVAAVFVGCLHGYEQQVAAPTFTLDGVAQALSNGQTVMGSTLVISRPTRLHHPYDAPTLTGAISNSDTVVPLTAIPAWVPASGHVTIEAEVMHYASRTGSQLNIDVRADGSAGSGGAAAHASGVAVNFNPGVHIADVATTYTVDGNGIETLHLTTFLEAMQVVRSYPVMFPVDGYQMTHAFLGSTEHAMTPNVNGEFGHTTDTVVVFFTDRADAVPDVNLTPHRVAVRGEILDPADTVENYTYATSPLLNFMLQDRTPAGASAAMSHMHKGYPTHIAVASPGMAVASGAVWRSRSRRMAVLITDHNYDLRVGEPVQRGRRRRGARARALR